MLCIVFGLIIFYQYKREADYRAKMFVAELDLIDSRILEAYHEDVNLRGFLSFIQQFFKDSMFDGVRVSVYADGRLYYSLGVPIPLDVSGLQTKGKYASVAQNGQSVKVLGEDDDQFYFLSTAKSDDGRIVIRTAMPYNDEVHDEVDIDRTVWLVIAGCLLLTLIVVYFSTRAFTKHSAAQRLRLSCIDRRTLHG